VTACDLSSLPLTLLQPQATLGPEALTGTMSAAETLTAMPTSTATVAPSRTPTETATITLTPVATQTLAPMITFSAATNIPTLTKMPSLTPIRKPAATPLPVCDGGSYVADVTVPDGTTFAPGERFIKTWRVKNNGTCTWTTAYTLNFSSGDRFSAPVSIPMPASVAPGQTVDISISMIAPTTAGSYKSNWMFKNASGGTFGVGATSKYTTPLWADIKVAGSSVQGIAYDFTQNACAATWTSGWGTLPCPGVNGDARGFALPQNTPKMETGTNDTQPGLITFPQSITNGYIRGVYPAYAVKSGDKFQTNLDCEYNNTACNVTFTLGYISGGIYNTLFQKVELYDGKISSQTLDLSSLAGQSVQFVLQVDANGAATQARAQWLHPVILGAPAPTPTPSITPIPSITPTPTLTSTGTPVPVTLLDFTQQVCTATWLGLFGNLTGCPQAVSNAGYAIAASTIKLEDGKTYNTPSLVLYPSLNVDPLDPRRGFIVGSYTAQPITLQAGDRFVALIGCEFNKPGCNVLFTLQYDDGSGTKYLTSEIQTNDGTVKALNIDLSSLAGKTVRFTLQIDAQAPSTDNRFILISPLVIR
jgi:hypothetical protein